MPKDSKRIFTKIETLEGLSPSVHGELSITAEEAKAEESPPTEATLTETTDEIPKIKIFKRIIFQKLDTFPLNENLQENQEPEKKDELTPTISPPVPIEINKAVVVSKAVPTISGEVFGNFTLKMHGKIKYTDKNWHTVTCYEMEILTTSGEAFVGIVPGSQLDDLNWIKEISGGAAYFSTMKNARKQVLDLIHSLLDANVEEEIVFTENGWMRIGNNWHYVIDSGIIGLDQKIYKGDVNHSFIFDVQNVGKENIFQSAMNMNEICHDKSITLPLFLFTHLGSLCKLFELADVPIKAVMAIIGTTNSRKTSMALCMTKTFGRENITIPEISFESTEGGIEVESSKHADSVLLIDDFHPTTSKKNFNKLMKILEFILRRYGDRTIKKRMTDFSPNRTAGSYDVNGVCVITGEDIGGVQSSLTRVLILEVDKFSVKNDVLGFYQHNPLILNTHLYDFITYVSCNFEQLVSFIKKRVLEWRKEKTYPISRYSEYYAQLMTCAEILASYALERGFWGHQEAEEWKMWCSKILDKIIEKNLLSTEREDFAIMIIQALQIAIDEHGVLQFKDLQQKSVPYKTILEDENYYFIKKEYLIELTNNFWNRLGKDLPFSTANQLAIFLEQKDLIVVREEADGKRRSLALPGRKQRFLYIKKSKMKELLEKVEI